MPRLKQVLQLFKNHCNIMHQFDIAKDYRMLKSNFSFLRETPGQSTGKKVLIVSLTHFLYQVKEEAMFAKALQLQGCEITVLTYKHCIWPQKYFRLFGITKFIFFEDYLINVNNGDVERAANDFLQKQISFQEVKKWQFKDCHIGQQVLSSFARRMHGTPNLLLPHVYNVFSFLLHDEIKTVFASDLLLDEMRPDILIFNEAKGSVYGGISDLAFSKHMDCIQFVQPLHDDAVVLKRFDNESMGSHPNSLSKSTFERIKAMSWSQGQEREVFNEFEKRYKGEWFLSQRNQIGTEKKSREQIIEQLGLDPQKKTAVVFSHILWDANLFYGDDLFEDYEEWFIETIQAAVENPNVNWIIKLHPGNVWKRNREKISGELREITLIREKVGELPKHVYLLHPDTDINTLSLFEIADYGITVRGTTGMELPCFGKQMFTAGTGRYSGFGFTVDSDSPEQYLDNLKHIHEFSQLTVEQALLAKKHAYSIFNLRLWSMRSFKAEFNYGKKGTHPLDHDLQPRIESYDELRKAEDLKRFSDWVLHNHENDYLKDTISLICVG
ncbi:hypothetical protein ACFL38_00535 [Candidatus Omnitrophota bacterium]